jgi:hypothetical protein
VGVFVYTLRQIKLVDELGSEFNERAPPSTTSPAAPAAPSSKQP